MPVDSLVWSIGVSSGLQKFTRKLYDRMRNSRKRSIQWPKLTKPYSFIAVLCNYCIFLQCSCKNLFLSGTLILTFVLYCVAFQLLSTVNFLDSHAKSVKHQNLPVGLTLVTGGSSLWKCVIPKQLVMGGRVGSNMTQVIGIMDAS